MSDSYTVTDRRGMRRSGSNFYVGDPSTEMRRLRQAGYTLPKSPVQARIEAKKVAQTATGGSLVDSVTASENRIKAAQMRRGRMGGMGRTASNVTMAMPKIRQPFSSLEDKGIPFNIQEPKELEEARRWCRLYYSTHDLVPLLMDIYARFPVVGLEFKSSDKKIKDFYEQMFMNDLNYGEFLSEGLGREYFCVGEVTSLAHFNESLGIWSSEEILNPDMVRVSKSLFVQQERVQLMVKELVENLRSGPQSTGDSGETPSERLERSAEYEQLLKHYPEIVQAANQDDGLDISDALVSRLVNKAAYWDLRGTPHLMRSFRTLMMEESLNAAQDAVCFPAGTPVLTSTGAKLIEDVTADDEVLTHRGRYRSVVRTMRRDADDAGVTIRWWYDRPMTLTAEHPVYIRRKAVHRGICAVCRRSTDKPHRIVCDDHVASRVEPSGRLQRAVCCLCGAKANAPKSNHCDLHDPDNQSYVEGFIPASEVSVYDQVLHPDSPDSGREYISIWEHLSPSDWVVYDPTDTAWGFSGHDWYDSAATQTKRVAKNRAKKVIDAVRANPGDILRHSRLNAKTSHFRAEYKLTEDLLWLVGLHVADGSAMINNSSGTPHGSVVITLGEHETDIADRAAQVFTDVFGVTPTITPCRGTKAIKVSANSLALAMWFREMCGVKGTKRFPSWAFGLTAPQTAALIRGWMDGDGHTNDVRTQGSTAYRHLQESAAWLMRRAGKITSTFRTEGTGFGVRHHQYVVTTVKTPRRAYPADQGGYWVEVRSVDHHQVTGLVYNLEVDEDNSYCTPIAVHNCDRMYSPLILATMGIENMGDGEPWIPDQSELDDLRDDMQNALAADFKLLVHNFGVNVQSVFGREAMPRFDADYDRIDAKLLQAWGIGQALIAGGSGAGGTYASSSLNREVCEQLMLGFQKKVLRHMRKRAEVIAEAQEHYDYDLKGGVRVPIYREVVQYNEETGEEEIVRVPKLLIPDINFAVLNLRDEAQERQFIAQLKQMGVPVSDGTLAVNIPIEFSQELEKQAEETVSKGLAKAQAMEKLQKLCDAQGLPYPDDLVASLSATLQLRQGLAQTTLVEGQAEMQDQQIKQMAAPAAAGMGLLPGVSPPPPPEEGGQQKAASTGPHGSGPYGSGPGGVETVDTDEVPTELPRNRARPAESDEQRASMPKGARRSRFASPSSYGKARTADARRVERAIQRRAGVWTVDDLVHDPEAYAITGMSGYEAQIRADWPEIQAGGAPESRKLLEELVEQYAEVTGITVRWD